MTVAELVEKLKALPQEMSVLTDGYEGGFAHVLIPELRNVARKENGWFYGPFDEPYIEEGEAPGTDVVYIPSSSSQVIGMRAESDPERNAPLAGEK